jgi:hypothetical protein
MPSITPDNLDLVVVLLQLARESQEAVLQQAAAMAGSEGTAVAEEARWHQIQVKGRHVDMVALQHVVLLLDCGMPVDEA